MKIMLFGAQAAELTDDVAKHRQLEVVQTDPDVVVCYGGDGTLLSAELQWPGIPKAPIRNSRKGHRCIAHPPARVIERLATGRLVREEYIKLRCTLRRPGQTKAETVYDAMNEFSLHNARINSAVRFKLWIDDEPYQSGIEIIGDGVVVSTPFGSTAYYNQITRGVFYTGLGVALKYTSEHTNHMVLPDTCTVRVAITRGPASLAVDNAPGHFDLIEHDEMTISKSDHPAVLYTWDRMKFPSDAF